MKLFAFGILATVAAQHLMGTIEMHPVTSLVCFLISAGMVIHTLMDRD